MAPHVPPRPTCPGTLQLLFLLLLFLLPGVLNATHKHRHIVCLLSDIGSVCWPAGLPDGPNKCLYLFGVSTSCSAPLGAGAGGDCCDYDYVDDDDGAVSNHHQRPHRSLSVCVASPGDPGIWERPVYDLLCYEIITPEQR